MASSWKRAIMNQVQQVPQCFLHPIVFIALPPNADPRLQRTVYDVSWESSPTRMTCYLPQVGCSWAAAFWIRFFTFLLSLLISLIWLSSFSKTSHLAGRILLTWSLGSGFGDFSVNVYSPSIFYLIFPAITQLTPKHPRWAKHWRGGMIPEFLWWYEDRK